jgi:hypothetical protein
VELFFNQENQFFTEQAVSGGCGRGCLLDLGDRIARKHGDFRDFCRVF